MSNEALKLAERVVYDTTAKEVIVTLKDGSHRAWPVRLLEMVKHLFEDWMPLEHVSD